MQPYPQGQYRCFINSYGETIVTKTRPPDNRQRTDPPPKVPILTGFVLRRTVFIIGVTNRDIRFSAGDLRNRAGEGHQCLEYVQRRAFSSPA
jgi:hypothetical protein